VLRARDFHLYLEGGKRLTDLWRQGGKAILGHKTPRVLFELKNAAERGLFCTFPHPLERRFLKALEGIFPGRQFRLFLNEGSLCQVQKTVSLWRPFAESMGDYSTMKIFTPVLPFPLGPEVLVLEKKMDFPAGELIPPVLLAPAARALSDLAAAMKAKTLPRFPRIDKVASCRWQRQGIYLKTETKGDGYAALFRCFLEAGFLLPPSPAEPAILPFSMSSGEEAKLAQLLTR